MYTKANALPRKGTKIEDVHVGEYVDMGAGCYCQLRDDGWIQWDGGYGIAVTPEEVKGWLS